MSILEETQLTVDNLLFIVSRLNDEEWAEFEAGLQQLQALRHREPHQARDDAAAQIASQRPEQIESICQHYQVAELALFGSVLRDDFDTDSDVDVLVSFEPTAQIGLIAFNQLQAELTRLFNRPVDLVPKQGLKPFIKETVLQQAKVIYARP